MALPRLGKAVLDLVTSYDGSGAKAASQDIKQVRQDYRTVGNDVRVISRQLAGFGSEFAGTQMLSRANNMAIAVQRLGGATKLTEAEQKRLNTTLGEALAKYKALGLQAPKTMVDLHKATMAASQPTGFLTTKMVGLSVAAGTFAGQVARDMVGQLVAIAKESFHAASQLVDMSNATGLSTATLQQMRYVAAQTGTTLDNFTNAAFRLGVTLADGSNSTRGAVRALGLSLDDLQAMRPDEQFRVIVTALARVSDQQERNRLGVALFGKQFKEIAAAVQEGYDDIAKGASLQSDVQVQALSRANNAWDAWWTNTKSNIGAFMGELVLAQQQVAKMKLDPPQILIPPVVARGVVGVGLGIRNFFNPSGPQFGPPVPPNLGVGSSPETAADFVARLAEAREKIGKLDAARQAQLAAQLKAAKATHAEAEEIAALGKAYGLTAEQLDVFEADRDAAEAKRRENAKTTEKEQAELEQWTTANATELKRLEKTITDATAAGIPYKDILALIGDRTEDAAEKARIFGNAIPEQTAKMAAAVVQAKLLADAFKLETSGLGGGIPEMPGAYRIRGGPDDDAVYWRSRDERVAASMAFRQQQELEAAEYAVELARAAGAREEQLFALTQALERKKVEVVIAAERAKFEARTRGMDQSSDEYKAELAAFEQLQAQLTEAADLAAARRVEVARTEAVRSAHAQREAFLKNLFEPLRRATIGSAGRLLLGGIGHDPDGQLKSAARSAELEYRKLERTGKATARELALAYKNWRDAEERANYGLGRRWKEFLGGFKNAWVDTLDQMLQEFLQGFLKGLFKGLAGSNLGQRLAGMFTGGGGGIPGGGLMNMAGGGGGGWKGAVGRFLGFGGGGGAGTAGLTSAGLIPSSTVSTSTLAGMSAAPSVTAGVHGTATAGTAGGGSFLMNPAFWSNPYTIGIGAAAAVLTWGITKKGWFRGGWEGIKGNKLRDQFWMDNFGAAGQAGANRFAAWVTSTGGGEGGGALYRQIQSADNEKKMRAAFAAIQAYGAAHGRTFRIPSFGFGGVVPGLVGIPRLIQAHGGEGVLTQRTTAKLGGQAGLTAIEQIARSPFFGRGSLGMPGVTLSLALPRMVTDALARTQQMHSLAFAAAGNGGSIADRPTVIQSDNRTYHVHALDALSVADFFDKHLPGSVSRTTKFNRGRINNAIARGQR